MQKEYVIAYDVGTGSVKAALVDTELNIKEIDIRDYPICNPKMGWAEQEPEDYWEAVTVVTKNIIAKAGINPLEVKAIAFSCQAMGIIPMDDKASCLYRNISWVDGRAEDEAEKINAMLGENRFGPKSVICKLLWLKNREPEVYKKTNCFLDVNGFLKFKATGKSVMERTGACSYAFDLKHLCWDEPLFDQVGIDLKKLPQIVSSTDAVGTLTENAAKDLGLHTGVIVAGGCNDVEAAAIGSGALGDGEGHIYLGSSAWICATHFDLPSPGSGFTVSKSPAPKGYLLKGVMQSCGMTVDKAIGLLYGQEQSDETINEFDVIETEVSAVRPGSENLIITPWIYGETCPVTSESIRSTIFNFTNIHTRAHLIKAIREGIAFNLRWIKENMKTLYGVGYKELSVVGGGGLSDDWMQCMADVLQIPLCVTENTRHAGTVGAAICALIGYGCFDNFDEAKAAIKIKKRYMPERETGAVYTKLYLQYKELYDALKDSYSRINV